MTNIDDSKNPEFPPGYWFGEIQSRLRERMRDALAEQDLRRGGWRLLHLLSEGPATPLELADRLPRGRRHDRGEAAYGRRPGWHGAPQWRGAHPHPGYRGQDPDAPEAGAPAEHDRERDTRDADAQHAHHGPDHHGPDHDAHHHDDEHMHHQPHHDDDHQPHQDDDHDTHRHHPHYRGDQHTHPHHHDPAEAAFERGFERGFLRGFGADPRRHGDPRGGFGRPGFGYGGYGGPGFPGPGFGGHFPGRGFDEHFPGPGFGGHVPGHGLPGRSDGTDRDGRWGHPRPHHRLHRIERILADFTERGWVWFDGERATLTEEGRAAHDAAEERVAQVRASLADGIDPADWATTMRTLERMAENLGWERRA